MQQKVLIVDDAPANITRLSDMLQAHYEIRTASSGQQALDIATADEQPDLILLDLVLPGMDGYQVCRQLKARESTKNIPIIFTTERLDEADEARGLEMGAVDYLAKPFRLAIVKARVKNHLEMKRREDMLERLACIDGVTEIPNRRRFDEFFDQEWRRAMRVGEVVTLILMDVDDFKAFNAQYGHAMGDDRLRIMAQLLARLVQRSSDLIARYSGEKFVCVLTQSDHTRAVNMAEKMRQQILALAVPHVGGAVSQQVTVSVGVASISPEIGDVQDILVGAAQKMLDQAKQKGKNQVQSFAMA